MLNKKHVRILSICDEIFNPQICHELARQTKFIQRSSSKIHGHDLLKALILPSEGLSTDSLSGQCERIREFNSKADLSAPGLSQRINTKGCVKFMQKCFERILNLTRERWARTLPKGALNGFTNIYLQDSTICEVHRSLARFFPGTKRGGTKQKLACRSQIKFDLIHNFTTGEIVDLEICEGRRSDQALLSKIEGRIGKSDLVIRDLGYFKIESLAAIANKNAYFLSRFLPHVKVYLNRGDTQAIDLSRYLDKWSKKGPVDVKVYISQAQLEVRLVAYRVPSQVVAERLRNAHKRARSSGRTLSKEKRRLMQFTIFITNIPEEMISTEAIGTLYRLRWEIELIFKNWKSDLRIDVLAGTRFYRIKTLLWSRLCMVVILAYIETGFQSIARQLGEIELSASKLIRYLKRNGTLCKAVQIKELNALEQRMIADMSRRLLKDKRTRKTMRQKASDSESYYQGAANA
jgi:hypothetical protein